MQRGEGLGLSHHSVLQLTFSFVTEALLFDVCDLQLLSESIYLLIEVVVRHDRLLTKVLLQHGGSGSSFFQFDLFLFPTIRIHPSESVVVVRRVACSS